MNNASVASNRLTQTWRAEQNVRKKSHILDRIVRTKSKIVEQIVQTKSDILDQIIWT